MIYKSQFRIGPLTIYNMILFLEHAPRLRTHTQIIMVRIIHMHMVSCELACRAHMRPCQSWGRWGIERYQ